MTIGTVQQPGHFPTKFAYSCAPSAKRAARGVLLAVLFFIITPFSSALAQGENSLGIVAVVNDEIISAFDLESRLSLVLTSSRGTNDANARKRLAPQVLRGLIDEKLKLQDANRLNIHITKKEIDRALFSIERQNNLPRGGLDSFLKKTGVNKLTLIKQIEADIAWNKVINRRFRPDITIGDDEIDEVLRKFAANKGRPEYLVAEIFIPLDNPRQANETLAMTNRLVQQIKEGANFMAVARSFSQSAAAAVGGDLGWIKQGQLGPKIDDAIRRLQPGQVSPPIKTLAGYHILLLRKTRIDPGPPVPNIKVSLQQLVIPLQQNASPSEVSGQMKLARTMGSVAKNCSDMGKLGKESGSKLSGNLGNVSINKLPDNIREAVKNLPVNSAAPPIRTKDGLVVLMVCNRKGSDYITAERNRIKDNIMNERLGIAARRHLRDLRNSAFIEVRM